jgi:hypothetical protein
MNEIARLDRLGILARISLESPPKIGASPRSKPIAASCIPKKFQIVEHCNRCILVYASNCSQQFSKFELSHKAKEIAAPQRIDNAKQSLVLRFGGG